MPEGERDSTIQIDAKSIQSTIRGGKVVTGRQDGEQLVFYKKDSNTPESKKDYEDSNINEILTDFTPPPHECRVVATHEKVDNDGNLVLTPYLGPDRATPEGRKDDANSQWTYLSLPATGYSRYHEGQWDGSVKACKRRTSQRSSTTRTSSSTARRASG